MDAIQGLEGPGEIRGDSEVEGPPSNRGNGQPSGPTHGRAVGEDLPTRESQESGSLRAPAVFVLPVRVDPRHPVGDLNISVPIWFRSNTSLWHIWKLTPEGTEGTQWTECLETIENPVTYAPAPTPGQPWRGTGRKGGRVRATARVCDRCQRFALLMRRYWMAEMPNTMAGPSPTMIGRKANPIPRSEHGKDPMG